MSHKPHSRRNSTWSVRKTLEALLWLAAVVGFFYLIWHPPGG
jgi:hypothetical protein